MNLPTRPLAALLLAGGLLLAGCSGDAATTGTESPTAAESVDETAPIDAAAASGGTCEATVDDGAADPAPADEAASRESLASVGVSEDPSAAPTVTFEAPLPIGTAVTRVVSEGTGETVAEGDLITIHYVVCDMATGEKLYSTWGETSDTDTPESYILSADNLGPTLTAALDGANTGTQVLWAQPGYSAEESGTGEAVNGVLYTLSVADSTPVADEASGTEVIPTDDSLPVITFADGKPSVSVPDNFTDPSELVVQPLIEGDGDTVEAGQTVMVKYTGWLTDGTQFDSSWDRGAPDDVFSFQVGAGGVIQGWEEGVLGSSVGSRLLLVIPSEMGYGAAGSGAIPGDATLIFVVDILAAH